MSATAPSGPTTPEPIRNAADVQAWFLRGLGLFAVLTARFQWWTPTPEDLLFWAGFGTVGLSFLVDLWGRVTRKKVVPIQNVALTVADLNAINLAEADAVSLKAGPPNPRFNDDGPVGMLPPG